MMSMPEWELGEGAPFFKELSLAGVCKREAIPRADVLDQSWMVAVRNENNGDHVIIHTL